MATVKKSRIIALFSALVMGIMVICSSAMVVFADTAGADVNGYIESQKQFVIDSKVDPDNLFEQIGKDPDKAEALKKAQEVVIIAGLANDLRNEYSDENIAMNFEKASTAEVKSVRDNILTNILVVSDRLVHGAEWVMEKDRIHNELGKEKDKIIDIKMRDVNNFKTYQEKAEKAVVDAFQKLTKVNRENQGASPSSLVGMYTDSQLEILTKVYNEHVTEEGKFVEPVVYDASEVDECRKAVDQKKNNAINALQGVAKNELELAYGMCMDFINNSANEDKTEQELEAEKKKVESSARAGLRFYDNASEAVKKNYSSMAETLKQILENDVLYVPVKTDEVRTSVVTIKAKWKNGGSPADALPQKNLKISVSQGRNSSAKRNATVAMKAHSKDLSVAYYIYISLRYNGSEYKLPSKVAKTDESGKVITNSRGDVLFGDVVYEVSIDLEKYYSSVLEKDNLEANKIENIKDANQTISQAEDKEGLSLCYSYSSGEVTQLDCKLEGGVLVFTTTELNNICIAGTNLDSIFQSPWLYVGIILFIIIAIIVLVIVLKNVRYKIKFVTNGGSNVAPVKAAKNETFVMPQNPVKQGFVFAGWYLDQNLTTRFMDTVMRKRKSFKLYAKWVAPVSEEFLIDMYEDLRSEMSAYRKESFSATMGLKEAELIASMKLCDNHIELSLALTPEDAENAGVEYTVNTMPELAEVPVKLNISNELSYINAVKLIKKTFTFKGLVYNADHAVLERHTEEQRENGFAYFVHNEKVAESAKDYFNLLRIALKSYVMEKENPQFKAGDTLTLARIYITNDVCCMHLPVVQGDRNLERASEDMVYADTPVVFRVLSARDMEEAYILLDKVMNAYGLVKCPENANDLKDQQVEDTNGFAYTLRF